MVMALSCPVCSATTKGNGDPFDSPRSVEAHISAKRDDDHRGKQGKEFRGQIQGNGAQDVVADAAADAGGGNDDSPSGGDGTREAGNSTDSDGQDGGRDDGLPSTNEELDGMLTAASEAGREEGREEMAGAIEAMEEELQAKERRIAQLEERVDPAVLCPNCDEPLATPEELENAGAFECDGCGFPHGENRHMEMENGELMQAEVGSMMTTRDPLETETTAEQ